MSQIYDTCVIGLGIAGLTASLYLLRQKVNVLAIGREIGGQLMKIPHIENYPGVGVVKGSDIINKILGELYKYGFKFIIDEVVKVEKVEDIFKIITRSGREYYSRSVICTTGKSPIKLNVDGEDRFLGRGVSYCVICDAALFKGKTVLYVSGSDPHVEFSLDTLLKTCSKVYWIPRVKIRDVEDRYREYLESGKLQILDNCNVVKIDGDVKVRRVLIKINGELKYLDVDGVFIEIGYRVDTGYISHLVKVNEKGEIVVDELCRTSVDGIFAAGDVTSIPYKQAIIAAGQGAIAALSACEYLSKKYGLKIRKVDWSIK